ncbi:class A beta-lactamase [Streptomyces brasiliscabiei]|uniref:class A beta-lactamase n=1 Tax=Streptomyces brasiliscabiei TaxID=2736302 RepID=UPI0038F78971
METTGSRPGRRTALGLGGLTGLGALGALGALGGLGALGAGTAHASAPADAGLSRRLAELEREHAARVGVFAHDTATGRSVAYRADERFPMCSVFKTLGAAVVLRDLDRDGEYLAKRIHYTKEYVEAAGYCPVTGTDANVAAGMTVAELCAASVSHSDNGAANLLLREVGGPTAITRFSRSLGDRTTRLDRWEPELNSAEPWRKTDTTTPRAIGGTYARIILGRALPDADRELLTGWMIANSTNVARFRAGLPADWTLADKTGGGSSYGVANDVGVVWPPLRPPLVLAVLTTKLAAEGPSDNPLVAKVAGLLAETLTPRGV